MDLVFWSTNRKFQEKHHVPHVCPNCRGVEPGPVMNQWFQGCFTSSSTWVLRALAISLHDTARWWHPDDQSVAGSDKQRRRARYESNFPCESNRHPKRIMRRDLILRRVYIINNNQSPSVSSQLVSSIGSDKLLWFFHIHSRIHIQTHSWIIAVYKPGQCSLYIIH